MKRIAVRGDTFWNAEARQRTAERLRTTRRQLRITDRFYEHAMREANRCAVYDLYLCDVVVRQEAVQRVRDASQNRK